MLDHHLTAVGGASCYSEYVASEFFEGVFKGSNNKEKSRATAMGLYTRTVVPAVKGFLAVLNAFFFVLSGMLWVSHLAIRPLNVHATRFLLLDALHPHLISYFEIHLHPMMIYLSLLLKSPSNLIIHFCFLHHHFIMPH